MVYNILLHQLLLSFSTLLIVYFVGKIIISFFEVTGNAFFKLFVTNIIGIMSIVLIYSVIHARGRTVLILLLPFVVYLSLFYKVSFRKKIKINKQEIVTDLLLMILPFCAIFSFQSYFYFDFNHNAIKTVFGDYYCYANFADSLKLWGTESLSKDLNYFFTDFRVKLQPYHYPELWFTAFFSSLFRNSTFSTYYFTTYTICVTTFCIGICSINTLKSTVLTLSISLLLLFTSCVVLPFYIVNTHLGWGILDILGQKLALIYCFILLSFILINNNKWKLGLQIISIIPILSVTFVVGVWLGLLLFVAVIFFDRKTISKKELLVVSLQVILQIILFYLFYGIVCKTNNSDNQTVHSILSNGIFKQFDGTLNIHNIKIILSNFIVYTIPTVLIHLGVRLYLFLFFGIIFFRSFIKKWNILLLIVCFLFFGGVASAIANNIMDSIQFTEVLTSFLIILSILIISNYISNYKSYNRLLTIIIGILLLNQYSNFVNKITIREVIPTKDDTEFLKKIANSLGNKSPVVVLSFYNNDFIKNAISYAWIRSGDFPDISMYTNTVVIPVVGNPELFLKTKKLTSTDSLFYYSLTPINLWKERNKHLPIESFIKYYNITCFYFKAGQEIPLYIKKRIYTSIESIKTHSTFIIIR